MNKKSKKRIIYTLITIIILGIIAVPLYPKLSQLTGLSSFLGAKAPSEVGNSDSTSQDTGKANPREDVATTENTEPKSNMYTPPEDSSYLMLNLRTGDSLSEKNGAIRRAPASTVKLLTGILIHEKLEETDLITVGTEVTVGGSSLGLKPGDQILVKDLFTAMYVGSANDAANALAITAYGTMNDFIDAMNQFAVQLGCADSQFMTANGMPEPNQYTTAHDLAIIATKFIENKALMEYVSKKNATIEWKDVNGWKQIRKISNTNQLLGVYPGDLGLKTGTTTEAGQCLVSYVTREDAEILLVLLGSKQRYTDTIELLDEGFAKLRTRSALKNITASPDSFHHMPGFFSP